MNVRNLVILAAVGITAAACGATPSGQSDAAGNGSAPAPQDAVPAAPVSAQLSAAAVAVGGKTETILVDHRGLTLYYFTPDKNGKPTCRGGCAAAWPAATLAAGAPRPAAPAGIAGVVGSVAAVAGGSQLTFNGWPLYTYSGDQAAGDVNGQGSGGKWFVVTSQLAAAGGATSVTSGGSTSGTATGGAYG